MQNYTVNIALDSFDLILIWVLNFVLIWLKVTKVVKYSKVKVK